MKTVSVVMATYNGEKYLKEQLDSIINQTYPIHEIIIQDDCSTDGTIAIIEEYAKKHSNIKLFINEKNLGYNKNFKSVAMKASGDFIAISDQDDVWFPEKIDKQVKAIGDYDICAAPYVRGRDLKNTYVSTPKSSMEALLFGGFAGHTMLLNRSFAQTDDSWIDEIIYDWGLAICAQLKNGIVMLEEPLNWHRTHDESACTIENKKLNPYAVVSPTYQPYLFGLYNYYCLHKKPKWKKLYQYIYQHTKAPKYYPAHKMCGYMLSWNPLALLLLCCYCLKFGETIYPSNNTKEFMGKMRSFFYPFIFSYNNIRYE